MNGDNLVKFEDSSKMSQNINVKYLGGTITQDVNVRAEISGRLNSTTIGVSKKLHDFWRLDTCSVRWRLLVCDAVVRAKALLRFRDCEPNTDR